MGDPLIVGIELVREHQAISFHAKETVGRRRLRRTPAEVSGRLLEEAEALRGKYGKDRVLFAMEPPTRGGSSLADTDRSADSVTD